MSSSTHDKLADSIISLVYRVLGRGDAPVAKVHQAVFSNVNAGDANLSDVVLIHGNSPVTGVPKIGSGSFTAGDPLLIITGPNTPYTIIGKVFGDITNVISPPASIMLPQTGVWLGDGSYGTADFAGSAAAWNSLTGILFPVTRHYKGAGDYVISPGITEKISAGIKICLSLSPDVSPPSGTSLTDITGMLATLQSMGADVQVTLHHEPFYSGLSASDYVTMIQYYSAAVRNYYPLWVCFSGFDAVESNGYFPGAAYVDGVAVDAYSTDTATLTNGQAMADAHGLPFGVWEFNTANDLGIDPSPVSGRSHATEGTFWTTLQNLFVARTAAGKPSGAVIFFSDYTPTSGTSNFFTSGVTALGGFEGSLANWVNSFNTTLTNTTADAKSGTKSMQMSSIAAGTMGVFHCSGGTVTTNGLPCNPGDKVAATVWVKSASGSTLRNCHTDVGFFTSGGVSVSTVLGSNVLEVAGQWKLVSVVATVPATAAFARLNFTVISTAGVAEIHYMDDPQMCVLPPVSDFTAPLQYSWDYRAALLSTLQGTIG